nr:hypothetical protein [Parachlamydiaceae bacterium]
MLSDFPLKFLSVLLATTLTLSADTPHKVLVEQTPRLILHYTLKDLGESDLNPESLTRQQDGLSLGP